MNKIIPIMIWLAGVGFGLAQERLPVPAPAEPVVDATDLGPALAVLRIPAEVIAREASETFRHTSPVDRIVLGTHSRGTAVCVGTVDCVLEEHPGGAEFVCHISGTITSHTRGLNGPAVICSSAETQYAAVKRIVFDGRQLSSGPAVLSASTDVDITGIGSTSPGLRGRIVQRVASRRAADSLLEAEAITRQLTIGELQQHIDAEFSQRISSLNRKLATRLAILDAFTQGDYEISVRSQREFIEILLRSPTEPAAPASVHALLPELPRSEGVVLWLPRPTLDLSDLAALDWQLSDALQLIPAWLASPLAQFQPLVGERSTRRIELLKHENWIGFEIGPAKAGNGARQ